MNIRIDVSGVRSSCETDDEEVVLDRGQRGAAGHEDRPQHVADQRRRAERQHQDPADRRATDCEPPSATKTMPTAVIRTVGTSAVAA